VGFRSRALAILGALAILAAGAGAHGHTDRGPALDKPCAICAAQAQGTATPAEPAIVFTPASQARLELVQPAPVARDAATRGSAVPRGPPSTN
jgi:hypothetical protein